LCAGRCRGRRGGSALAAALASGISDALHVARLADQARHLGEASAFDADVGEERVDERGLNAIAQRGVDHLVGGAAAAVAIAAAIAIETVDLEDADAFDFLHWLDALAHDPLNAVEQL